METIGQRLRRLRLERGLSQRDLHVPGTTYAYISRIEADTRNPSVKALRMLARQLNVDPYYLETGLPDPDRQRARKAIELARLWRDRCAFLERRLTAFDGEAGDMETIATVLHDEVMRVRQMTIDEAIEEAARASTG